MNQTKYYTSDLVLNNEKHVTGTVIIKKGKQFYCENLTGENSCFYDRRLENFKYQKYKYTINKLNTPSEKNSAVSLVSDKYREKLKNHASNIMSNNLLICFSLFYVMSDSSKNLIIQHLGRSPKHVRLSGLTEIYCSL